VTRVGIVAKPDAPRAQAVIVELLSWLAGRGLGAVLEKETADLAASVAPAAAGNIDWRCNVAAGTNIKAKYLPANCR